MVDYQVTFNEDLQARITILERGLSQLGQGIILLEKTGHIIFSTDLANEMLQKKGWAGNKRRLFNWRY